MKCPHCDRSLTEGQVKTIWSQYTASKRTRFVAGPGRPKKLQPCPKCYARMGTVELRGHKCS